MNCNNENDLCMSLKWPLKHDCVHMNILLINLTKIHKSTKSMINAK